MKSAALICVLLAALSPSPLPAQNGSGDYLTPAEVDQVRDAQDPSDRIKLYVGFEQARLDKFTDLLQNRPYLGPSGDPGVLLERTLSQYVSIDNELKGWIQDQFDRGGDMRKGLRVLLEAGPSQLRGLQRIETVHSPYKDDYQTTLQDAIADVKDTLDGATQALQAQQKTFPAEEKQAKLDARELKKEQKEQKKENKKERKLRKKEKQHDDSGNN